MTITTASLRWGRLLKMFVTNLQMRFSHEEIIPTSGDAGGVAPFERADAGDYRQHPRCKLGRTCDFVS